MSSSNYTPAFLIGIDLGTTHTVVSYQSVNSKDTLPRIFPIEQLIAPGEVAARELLPSFRYHGVVDEFAGADTQLPWTDKPVTGDIPNVIIGEWARSLGSRSEGKQVVSAKSWLSHQHVDRNAAILPWDAAEGVGKVSPVVASASYLNYVRQAWDHAHPHDPMAQQHLVITIPASFDEGARALTVVAAKLAGLDNVLLLEEPQAVVYDWYVRHQHNAADLLADIPSIVVVDVGGGTTDLSLIAVQQQPELSLTRIGVGDHLMLGGDNLDLALAHQLEQQLKTNKTPLRAATLSTLIQQTRNAKELLLSDNAPEQTKVTLLGSGSRLIGASRSVELQREAVQQLTMSGFFPTVEIDAIPQKRSSAVVELGLPYVADPAISKHLAEFIKQHQQAHTASSEHRPPAVLLNGGVFNSPLIHQQIVAQFEHWYGSNITTLTNDNPNCAVAFGAVAYAAAKRGKLLQIGGGSPRSYFLKLDTDKHSDKGICILPKGQAEGDEVYLKQHTFMLTLGQPVKFNLFSTSHENSSVAGEIASLTADDFIELPPLIVTLPSHSDGPKAHAERVPVSLACQLTEVGTLLIQCVSVAAKPPYAEQRWTLEFAIRKSETATPSSSETIPQAKLAAGLSAIEAVYGSSQKQPDPKVVKRLRSDLEKTLGKRDSWPTPLLRELATGLIKGKKRRRRSQQHEQNWLRITGYCLRPGFGYAADEWRIEQVWGLYQHNIQFQNTASWADWWTFWRRISGGLTTQQQQRIYSDIAKFIPPAALRNNKLAKQAEQQGYVEMIRLIACLEKIAVENKVQLIDCLLQRVKKSQHAAVHWWAIGRIGSRKTFSDSAHTLVPPEHVHQWLSQILALDWQKQSEIAFAAVMMSVKTGIRTLDIDDEIRTKVLQKLAQSKAPESWSHMVSEVTTLSAEESKRFTGESFPTGLQLL